MEKLLVFGISDIEYNKIKQVAGRMKLRCEQFAPSDYSHTLEQLLGSGSSVSSAGAPITPVAASNVPIAPAAGSAQSVAESLLVMCDLSDKRIDKLLFELRRSDVVLDYKAILTPTNRKWTVSQLLLEMHREKAAYQRMQP